MLEQTMGFDRFYSAYQYMKEVRGGEDDDMLSEKIAELMGEGFQDLFPSLMQLIVCEQSAYGALES